MNAKLEAKENLRASKIRTEARTRANEFERKERELDLDEHNQIKKSHKLRNEINAKYDIDGGAVGSSKVSPDDNNNRPIPDPEVEILRAEIERLKAEKSSQKSPTSERQNDLDLSVKHEAKHEENTPSSYEAVKHEEILTTKGLTRGSDHDVFATSSEGVEKHEAKHEEIEREKGYAILNATSLYPEWKKELIVDNGLLWITRTKKWISAKNKSGEINLENYKEKYTQVENIDWKLGNNRMTKYILA